MPELPKFYVRSRKDHPRVWKAYEKLGAAAEGPLETKTRELIKLGTLAPRSPGTAAARQRRGSVRASASAGVAAATKSESAVHSHAHRALEAGATPDEIEHAVTLSITTLGFPAMMTALSWAQAAIAGHEA
jgi:alkylhydroperoxidase/carboxymuconolactone decarboxylase family protein YurZ